MLVVYAPCLQCCRTCAYEILILANVETARQSAHHHAALPVKILAMFEEKPMVAANAVDSLPG